MNVCGFTKLKINWLESHNFLDTSDLNEKKKRVLLEWVWRELSTICGTHFRQGRRRREGVVFTLHPKEQL